MVCEQLRHAMQHLLDVTFLSSSCWHLARTNHETVLSIRLLMSSDTLRIAGGTFVRWGRKDCPGNDTELVYSGKLLSIPFFSMSIPVESGVPAFTYLFYVNV